MGSLRTHQGVFARSLGWLQLRHVEVLRAELHDLEVRNPPTTAGGGSLVHMAKGSPMVPYFLPPFGWIGWRDANIVDFGFVLVGEGFSKLSTMGPY